MDKILAYFSIKYEGDWDSIYKAINQKERIDQDELDRVVYKLLLICLDSFH